jgi:rhamnose transport system permease protein
VIAGSAVGPEARLDRGSSLVIWIARLREAGIIVALLLLMTLVSFSNSTFLTTENFRNILLAIAILATLAIGETMVILAKQIDLSVAANMGVTVMIIAQVLKAHPGMSLAVAVLICVAIGIGLGAVNGLLVTVGRVPAIIATLGTLNIYHGIQSIASGGGEVVSGDLPTDYLNLAGSNAVAIPLPGGLVFSIRWLVIFPVVLAIVAAYFLRSTRTGRQVYAVGSNAVAARLAGVRVNWIVFMVFVLAGALSGLGGFLYGADYGTVTAGAGNGFELQVIAAVVIGGTTIAGGSGSMLGTILGCLLLGVVQNSLALLNLSEFWSQAITGMIILAAVVSDALISHRLQRLLQGVRR